MAGVVGDSAPIHRCPSVSTSTVVGGRGAKWKLQTLTAWPAVGYDVQSLAPGSWVFCCLGNRGNGMIIAPFPTFRSKFCWLIQPPTDAETLKHSLLASWAQAPHGPLILKDTQSTLGGYVPWLLGMEAPVVTSSPGPDQGALPACASEVFELWVVQKKVKTAVFGYFVTWKPSVEPSH